MATTAVNDPLYPPTMGTDEAIVGFTVVTWTAFTTAVNDGGIVTSAGGGGGMAPTVPTSGQIWPRGNW